MIRQAARRRARAPPHQAHACDWLAAHFSRMRAASALRLSIGWSCLYANESDGMVYYSMTVSTRAWGITPVSARNKSFWMLDRDPERKLWGSVVKWC